jgi:hypothetical protein
MSRLAAPGAARWRACPPARAVRALATLAVLLSALSPARLLAQDARLERRLDPPTRLVVGRLVDSARTAGLPTEPLVDKALEGASKRADGARIAAAVRTLAGELARARALLGADASVGEIVAGARALRAGVSPTVLQRFQRERARRPMAVALAVLGDLVARGVPADTAARTVLALTSDGARDEELVAYQRGLERGMQIGAPPAPLGGLGASSTGDAVPTAPPGSQGLSTAGSTAGRGGTTTRPPGKKPPRP